MTNESITVLEQTKHQVNYFRKKYITEFHKGRRKINGVQRSYQRTDTVLGLMLKNCVTYWLLRYKQAKK